MDREELKGKPGEELWDHSDRVFRLGLTHCCGELYLLTGDLGHRLGTYQMAFQANKYTQAALDRAVRDLRSSYTWTRRADGEFQGPKIMSDDPLVELTQSVQFAFAEWVRSWQPLIDAQASVIALILHLVGILTVKRSLSVGELVTALKAVPDKRRLSGLDEVFGDRLEWYHGEVRKMRNQLTHGERIPYLLPDPTGPDTIVEMKMLYSDQTLDKFYLGEFGTWCYGRHLLFCIAVAESLAVLL